MRPRATRHVWHQYVIRTARRDQLRDFLTSRRIGSEIYYPVPLHRQEALMSLGYARATFPKPSAPHAKSWRCPSSPNCARTSSRRVVRCHRSSFLQLSNRVVRTDRTLGLRQLKMRCICEDILRPKLQVLEYSPGASSDFTVVHRPNDA